jgi:hypothetical protein
MRIIRDGCGVALKQFLGAALCSLLSFANAFLHRFLTKPDCFAGGANHSLW